MTWLKSVCEIHLVHLVYINIIYTQATGILLVYPFHMDQSQSKTAVSFTFSVVILFILSLNTKQTTGNLSAFVPQY